MNAFSIRRAVVADAAALAEIAARTFTEAFASANTPEDLKLHLRSCYGLAQQTAEIEDRDITTLLALQGEELVGFAQVQRKAAPNCVVSERPVELRRLYLTRSAHGKGLATLLMNAIRKAAEEFGGLHLWLGVWEHNPRAIAFYVKCGFVKVGSQGFIVGTDQQTDFVFVSPLSLHGE